ncbi:hypothetical protein SAMN05216298_2333 [Glycomyces sambucus]|uniref:Uncharacterized protein n=1 Tax=Glycomyces sambucus TaxID=380244 RepID=A0A1G9GPD6_9ACTN|nr:hypothetical protein [Glycomyces sambucus]SDL02539.1 hypothetical protein SAMN05216298_2333 [Glycomyces sambucus]
MTATQAATQATDRPSPRVVLLLFGNGAVKRANRYAAYACERGVRVEAVVADGQRWRRALEIHPMVAVHSLAAPENRLPGVWLYETLLERVPGGVLRRLDGRVPGGNAAARLHRRATTWLRRNVFWRVYGPVRHHALRPLAVRRLARLDLASADRVVCLEEATVPLGWSIAKRYPHLAVTRAVDPQAAHGDLPVTAPLEPWDPTDPDRPKREPYRPL